MIELKMDDKTRGDKLNSHDRDLPTIGMHNASRRGWTQDPSHRSSLGCKAQNGSFRTRSVLHHRRPFAVILLKSPTSPQLT